MMNVLMVKATTNEQYRKLRTLFGQVQLKGIIKSAYVTSSDSIDVREGINKRNNKEFKKSMARIEDRQYGKQSALVYMYTSYFRNSFLC
jgi:hypothetical protein